MEKHLVHPGAGRRALAAAHLAVGGAPLADVAGDDREGGEHGCEARAVQVVADRQARFGRAALKTCSRCADASTLW